jgi:phosphate/sulfate permease
MSLMRQDKCNRGLDFLLYSAGANKQILSRKDCQTEVNKQAAIGAIVCLTALTAGLSGSYAFYTVFASKAIAPALGSFWGLVIFHLDRVFILSARKKKNNFFGQIKVLVPRLMLAGFLGVTVSKPLELKIFETNIQEELVKQHEANLETKNQKIAATNKQLETKWDRDRKIRDDYLQSVIPEKVAQAEEITREMEVIQAKIKNNEKEIVQNKNRFENQPPQTVGLSKQLEILEQLATNDPIIGKISLFITLLFVMIEIAPMMAKLMSNYSPYDAILEHLEQKAIYYHSQHLLDAKEDINEHLENRKQIRNAVREKSRQRLIELLITQFLLLTEETAKSPEMAAIRLKAITYIAVQSEEVFMEQANQIKTIASEIEPELKKAKQKIIEQKAYEKVYEAETERQVAEVFDDLKNIEDFWK